MKVFDIAKSLEEWAPLNHQESYDNSGLLVGDPETDVTGILVSLDCTEEVIEDAIHKNCNLIVSHHPIVFRGLKRLTGSSYVERTVIKAIRNGIALYAVHTNLDNVLTGVNERIAARLGLENCKILAPKNGHLRKLVVFAPRDHAEKVRTALFGAGAGAIGKYDQCSYNIQGEGTFRGLEGSDGYLGEIGKRHTESETRIEVIYPRHLEKGILRAMMDAHPYEEVAHDIYSLTNTDQTIGSGMIGELEKAMPGEAFLRLLKDRMKTDCIRHTALLAKPIKKVALCGGSGSFLLKNAKQLDADIFITGDFKYHEFFDADGDIVIADIGHYESEQFTVDLLVEFLSRSFAELKITPTVVKTNPIHYI